MTLVTRKEAMDRLCVGRFALDTMIREGTIRAVKMTRGTSRIVGDDIEALIASASERHA